MAKISDQIRPSDVTVWGVVTIALWAGVLLFSNASALIPESVLAGLHSSRLAGATANQVRTQLENLATETGRLRQENNTLLQRFIVAEQANGEVTRRVGALEVSVPKLLEAIPADAMLDRGSVTASTGSIRAPAVTYDADGGSVAVRTTPFGNPSAASGVQPLPEQLASTTEAMPDSSAFGVALGPPFDANEAEGVWASLSARAGSLLNGLAPMTANMEGLSGKRLVAGPLIREKDANALCGSFAKLGIACSVVPFIGEPLPLLN